MSAFIFICFSFLIWGILLIYLPTEKFSVCILEFPSTGRRPKEHCLFSGKLGHLWASSALSSSQKAQWPSGVLSLKLRGLYSSFLTVGEVWRSKRTFSTILTHAESKISSKFPWTSIVTRLEYRETENSKALVLRTGKKEEIQQIYEGVIWRNAGSFEDGKWKLIAANEVLERN